MMNVTINSLVDDPVRSAIKSIGVQNERLILEQLEDLVKRDLLVIEQTEPVLTTTMEGEFRIDQKVRIFLKDQQYIEKLEARIKTLEAALVKELTDAHND